MITKPILTCPDDLVPILGTVSDEAAARIGRVSHPTVRRWRRERGIPAFVGTGRPPAVLVPPDVVRARLDALPGASWADVARGCGVSRQRVGQAIRDGLGADVLDVWTLRARAADRVPPPVVVIEPVPRTGPAMYRTPILTPAKTEAWLRAVRKAQGLVTWAQLAAYLGVHVSTVSGWRTHGARVGVLERARDRVLQRDASTIV